MSGQILFARTYLSMGITSEEMWGFSKEEEMQFLASHGKAVSRMVALVAGVEAVQPGQLVQSR